jgi:hypothetical protein
MPRIRTLVALLGLTVALTIAAAHVPAYHDSPVQFFAPPAAPLPASLKAADAPKLARAVFQHYPPAIHAAPLGAPPAREFIAPAAPARSIVQDQPSLYRRPPPEFSSRNS